jgi:hypothetical protein
MNEIGGGGKIAVVCGSMVPEVTYCGKTKL